MFIMNEADYQAASERINEPWNAQSGTKECAECEALCDAVDAYEGDDIDTLEYEYGIAVTA